MLEWLKNLLDGRVSDIKKPFGGTFIGISIIQNWKALYALAFGGSNSSVNDRIAIASNYTSEHCKYILDHIYCTRLESDITISFWQYFLCLVLWPSMLALFLIFIYPTLDSVASTINLFVKLKIKPTLISLISPRNLVPKDHYLTIKKNLENVQKKNNELQDDINALNSTKFSLNEELRKQQILVDEKNSLVVRNLWVDFRIGSIMSMVNELNIETAKNIPYNLIHEKISSNEIKIYQTIKGSQIEINSNPNNTFYLGSGNNEYQFNESKKTRFWNTIVDEAIFNQRWIEIKNQFISKGQMENCNWITDSYPLDKREATLGGKYYFFTWFILADTTNLEDPLFSFIIDDHVNIYLNYLKSPIISSTKGLDDIESLTIDRNKFLAGLNYLVFEITNIDSVAKDKEDGTHNPYGIMYKLNLRTKA